MTLSLSSAHDLGAHASWNGSTLEDYWVLVKPRVMALVVFTGFVGLVRAPQTLHPFWSMVALCCIAMGAGASAVLNMWYERHTDALMQRTQNRPLPQKRIRPEDALALGLILGISSVVLLGLVINKIAAGLLLFTIVFYVVVYTMVLKPRTPHNIVWGGLAGALPPVIGWACADHPWALEPWLLCLVIFLWTPPHFWALALAYQDDYQAAGLPMMPQVLGPAHTISQMRFYTLATSGAVLTLGLMPSTGLLFLGASTLCSGWFLWRIFKLNPSDCFQLKSFFKDSILYLFIIVTLLVGDTLL